MEAASWTFEGTQGSTFDSLPFTIDNDGTLWDLTGWTARMQIRPFIASDTVLLSATTSNYITLGGAAGTVRIVIPSGIMSTLPAGRHKYDLELDSGSVVYPILKGTFIINPEVTR